MKTTKENTMLIVFQKHIIQHKFNNYSTNRKKKDQKLYNKSNTIKYWHKAFVLLSIRKYNISIDVLFSLL
jgi:hypothetical protein